MKDKGLLVAILILPWVIVIFTLYGLKVESYITFGVLCVILYRSFLRDVEEPNFDHIERLGK